MKRDASGNLLGSTVYFEIKDRADVGSRNDLFRAYRKDLETYFKRRAVACLVNGFVFINFELSNGRSKTEIVRRGL